MLKKAKIEENIYGKFKNNSGKKIKIKASCSQNDVTIKLLQLS